MQPLRRATVSWATLGAIGLGGLAILAAVAKDRPPAGAAADVASPAESEAARPRHAVAIQGASGPPGILTGEVDKFGNPVVANCTTCHATRPANPQRRHGSQLTDFHQGLVTQHGDLQCTACHHPENYSQLRLASGEAIEFADSLQLCAQCHGPQYRDYLNGAHGGMSGYWDLSRGPRTRNHCIVCHDPHSPQYQQVAPVFRPRDLAPPSRRTEEQR